MNKPLSLSGRAVSLWGTISVIVLTGLDQYTKYLARKCLADGRPLILLDGVLEFRHLENAGMAWGLLAGKVSFFLILCGVFFGVALYLYLKIPKNSYYLPLICLLFLMMSGAAGNFIDRITKGTVTDFIYISLIDFPIFNLADIYVVCSGFFLVLLIGFKYREEDFSFLKLRRRS